MHKHTHTHIHTHVYTHTKVCIKQIWLGYMQRKTRDEAECRENVRVCVCVGGGYISSRHPTPPHPPFYPLLVFVCVCVCVCVCLYVCV